MNRQEQVRKEILFQLYADRPRTRTTPQIKREAVKNGLDFTDAEIKREAVFLMDEGLLINVQMAGTTDLMFRIHANGVRHYEQNFAA